MAFHTGHKIKEATAKWKSINLLSCNVSPFQNEELFGENKNSVHELAKIIKPIIPLPATKPHSASDWHKVFTSTFDNSTQLAQSKNGATLRTMAIRMALSNPENLFDKEMWNGKVLPLRHDTVIWRAAYDLFGAPWYKAEETKVDKKRAAPTEQQQDSDTNDTETTKDAAESTGENPTQENNVERTSDRENVKNNKEGDHNNDEPIEPAEYLYLSKPRYPKIKKTKFNLVNPEHVRKYTTYYKIKFPRITKESVVEGDAEMIENFHTLVRRIFHIDASAIILPWNNEDYNLQNRVLLRVI